MLQIHPDDRISVTDALNHPYLRDFSGQMPEPNCPSLFEFDFEELIVSKIDLQAMMFMEMLSYRPNAGSVNDIPFEVRNRILSNTDSSRRRSREYKHTHSDSKMDEDSGDEMYTAREDDNGEMEQDDEYKSGYK